jgi:hypothetical protein
LYPNIDFLSRLYTDNQGISARCIDYFVFPDIRPTDISNIKEEEITITEQEFIEVIKNKRIINILSKENGGKSTFLKYFYNTFLDLGYTPIFVSSEDYNPKKLKAFLHDLFTEQYSPNPADFSKFLQLNKQQIIVFIDDIDRLTIDDNTILINHLLDFAGHIICTSKDKFDPNVIEAIKQRLALNNIATYRIAHFYKEKRSELVKKVCGLTRRFSSNDIDDIILVIDRLAQKRNGLFNLSPDFIVQYLRHFINGNPKEKRDEEAFNIIFENNIRNSIIVHTKRNDLSDFITILEEIAYMMHFNKIERITSEQISQLILNYNQDHILEVDDAAFIRSMTKARIIRLSTGLKYEFVSRNYLAYFIAKKISRKIEREGNADTDLAYLTRAICFSINDTILLFLSYIRSNTRFALRLCDEAESLVSEISEIDFDIPNIVFLRKNHSLKVCLPTSDEIKTHEHNIAKHEEQLEKYEEEMISYKGLYDYSEDDIDKMPYKLSRVAKYLEMIGKSFTSQYSVLNKPEKMRIMECLYGLPNRVLYAYFKPLDNCYDDIIKQLQDLQDEMEAEYRQKGREDFKRLSKVEIQNLFWKFSINICLSLYDDIGVVSANGRTLPALQLFTPKNSNHKIQKLIMVENGGTTQSFVEQAIKTYEETDDPFMCDLIRLVARAHIMTHPSINHSARDQIADKLFPPNNFVDSRKRLLMLNQKGTSQKK